jgi:bacillithiol system protein YtxJ
MFIKICNAPIMAGYQLFSISYFCAMKDWIAIKTEENLTEIIERSATKPQIIFKDSTTCGISAHAKHRLIEGYHSIEGKADFNYLDLLAYRPISHLIAEKLSVTHQSPQILVLKDRKVVYSTSHHAIEAAAIAKYL